MKRKNDIAIRSSAAEYLTCVAVVGDNDDSMEMRYEDENIWLTQLLKYFDELDSQFKEPKYNRC